MSLVLQERRGAIAIVTLNRPEVRNAIDSAITDEINDVFDRLGDDPSVSAVVITGAGDRAFCAGADLKATARRQASGGALKEPNGWAGITQRDFQKPLIAAVNGFALGGGLEIALSCDIVVAEEHAVFGLPEVKRGILAAAGGAIRLSRRVPMAIALEVGLTGEPLSAQRAYEVGLVNRVVPKGHSVQEAVRMAEVISQNAPLSVQTTKRLLRETFDHDEPEMWRRQAIYAKAVFASDDAREGRQAFAEKRAPVWRGR